MSGSLDGWIEGWAAETPDKKALISDGETITYAGLAARVAAHARLLHDMGVAPGDRIAYLGPNTAAFLHLFFAAAHLGAIFLPLNWRLAAGEHAYILGHAEPEALFADPGFADHAAALEGAAPSLAVVPCPAAGLAEEAAGGAPRAGGPASPVLLVYTSGTTGRPKGAVLTQEAIHVNALNCVHMHDMTADDVILTNIPLFHVGGLNILTTPAVMTGATVILHPRFDPEATLREIGDSRVTLHVSVPATMQALLAHPHWGATDLSSLKMLTTGSSVVPVPLIRAFLDRGVPVGQVYGATETAPAATYQRAAEGVAKPGSAGKAALHCEVRIDGDPPAGEAGEILVRGRNNFVEYWRDPAATEAAFEDGWFRTGDVGYVDADGDYWIKDRKKDVIISGGENVYPAEVEAVLHDMPEVADAAVVAGPDDRWGEVPVAVVVLREGAALDEATVILRFNGVLARFKHPKAVVFTDALPRNAMGKVLKYELRERVAGG